MRISCFALGFFRYPVFFPFNNSCRARRLFIQPVSFTGSSIHVLASRNNSNRSRVSPLTFFPSIFIDCPPNVGRFTLLNRTRAVDFQRPLFIGRRSYPPPRDEIRPRFYPRNGRPGRYSDIAWLVFFSTFEIASCHRHETLSATWSRFLLECVFSSSFFGGVSELDWTWQLFNCRTDGSFSGCWPELHRFTELNRVSLTEFESFETGLSLFPSRFCHFSSDSHYQNLNVNKNVDRFCFSFFSFRFFLP